MNSVYLNGNLRRAQRFFDTAAHTAMLKLRDYCFSFGMYSVYKAAKSADMLVAPNPQLQRMTSCIGGNYRTALY